MAIEPLELNHVSLHVADVAASAHFYGTVLGFAPLPRPDFDFPGAWFQLGPRQQLHLIGGRTEAAHGASRGDHFAVGVPAVHPAVAYLAAHGVTPVHGPKQRPDGIWQVFFADPDGHWIELTELD